MRLRRAVIISSGPTCCRPTPVRGADTDPNVNDFDSISPPSRPGAGFAIALLGVALVYYGRLLLGWFPIGADHSLMYAPFFSIDWADGPPLWNPYSLSGAPLVDNLQAALLYPLRWPFYFIGDWRWYYGPYHFLHYLVALVGAGLWLRSLRVSPSGAVVGAILFAAGGHMAGRIINPTIFWAACWLPALLYGASGRRAPQGWATTVAFAMILWIGSPHLMLYGLVGWMVVFFGHTFGGVRCWRLLGCRMLNLAAAVVLAAPTLLPGVLRSGISIRTETSALQNLADSLRFSEIVPMLLGGLGQASAGQLDYHPEYIDKCCYVGGLAFALILGLMLRRSAWRDRRVWMGGTLVIAGLVLALGKSIGLHQVMPFIPGYRLLMGAPRALVLTAAGLALLGGLGLDASARWSPRRAAVFLGSAGMILLAVFAVRAWSMTRQPGYGPDFLDLVGAWLFGPRAVGSFLFMWIDSGVVLALAGTVFLLPLRHWVAPRWMLLGLIALQLAHFGPRVWPPLDRGPMFDAPPNVRFLQAKEEAQTEPFRIAGYDPLRLNDGEMGQPHLVSILTPNLATLYRLEDIQGFDPLIFSRYAERFERTAGRADYNDPVRNLDLARPEERLFDILGVRYLVGHPRDRRICSEAMVMHPGRPEATVPPWPRVVRQHPVVQWQFVTMIREGLDVPFGAEIARLHVDALEGRFSFPIRNGIETRHRFALVRGEGPPQRGVINHVWRLPVVDFDSNYAFQECNYRSRIEFGRPLHVRRVRWELVREDLVFVVAGQAARLAPPPAGAARWRLVHGDPNQIAPVFEYLDAKPRAVLTGAYALEGDRAQVPARVLTDHPAAGSIEWKQNGLNGCTVEVETDQGGLLLFREIWTPAWRATIGGRPSPVFKVNGLLQGVEVPAGTSRVQLRYVPALAVWLLIPALLVVVFGAVRIGRYFCQVNRRD